MYALRGEGLDLGRVFEMFGNAVFRWRDDDRPPPEAKPEPRRATLGVALGGGAARGWAHIGVFRALTEAGLVPDVITGTSIGAVVGGCYAAGQFQNLEAFARGLTRRKIFGLLDLNFAGSGLISGNRLSRLLDARLRNTRIEDLKQRFVAIATELGTGHEVWMSRGRLVDAMRASYALPGIFQPVRINGRWLVDGALVNPIPVSAARALGAEVVIAVNLQPAGAGYIQTECTPYFVACMNNAAAAEKALADQRAFEVQVTGKTVEECQQSNATCEARVQSFGPAGAAYIRTECTPYFVACMNNAAAAQAATAPDTPPAPAPAPGGTQTASTCGIPGGTATIVIADPSINILNVRDKPKGEILSTLPENSQVNVVGGCGVGLAAGIVAQGNGGGQPPVPGWCAISAPTVGCVSEQFLVAGIPAGGQPAPAPAAGIVANKPQTPPAAQPPQQPPPVAETQAAASGGGQLARLKQGANIRNGPGSKKTTVLQSLPGGSTVTVLGCESGWCRLAMPQYPAAWVFQDFLTFADIHPMTGSSGQD